MNINDFQVHLLGENYFISSLRSHEEFNKDTMENNIAILQISRTISATPVCLLPPIEDITGKTAVILSKMDK